MPKMKKYKLLLWGAGKIYNGVKNCIAWYELSGQVEIVGIVANGLSGFLSLDNYKIVNRDSVNSHTFDYIIILSDIWERDIINEIEDKYGIERRKLIPYRVLLIPNLKFDDYIQVKESNLSIISNNCWGGVICHTLGIECRSPFKNLFVLDDDYIKLLRDFKSYMKEPLVYKCDETDPHSHKRYPVMLLGDLEIHCNHSQNPDEAGECWRRRCQKINYENLYVEMYTESRYTAEKFLKLEQFSRRVCFVPFDVEADSCLMKLPILSGQEEFWETVNSNGGIGTNGLVYSIVDLLMDRKESTNEGGSIWNRRLL